jgi:hypothetical protein
MAYDYIENAKAPAHEGNGAPRLALAHSRVARLDDSDRVRALLGFLGGIVPLQLEEKIVTTA